VTSGPKHVRHAFALATTLCALAPLPSSAQTVTTLPEVTVQAQSERADGPVQGYRATRSGTFTKTDTPLNEVPASVTVVPAQLMKDQAMQGMGEVIRYVPGVLMHQGEGNRDQVVLRGISTTADFYVDGVRDDAQVFRDLYNLERVEVLKGPGGMAFGRGGAGGVVNRVTKKPVFGSVGEATVSVGSWNQLRGAVDLGGKLNDAAAWRLNAMAQEGDSFRSGFDMKRTAANPTLTLVPGDSTSLTLGIESLRDERTADRGVPARNGRPIDADPSIFYGNASQSRAHSYVDGAYAILDHDFGGIQLKNSFRVTHYDKYYQNVYTDNANASSVTPSGTLRLAAYNNANQRTNVFNQTDLTTKVTAGGFEHTLLAGLELGRQDSSNRRNTGVFGGATLATVSAGSPLAVATSFPGIASDAYNNVKSDVAAVYFQDQVALSRQWKLLAGLRFDHFRTAFDDRRAGQPDLARTDNAFSPRVGLIWQPTGASTYYASYSYAFLPSGEQLSLAPNTADLAPEKAKNYELGGRWDLSPRLTLSSALFRLDRDQVRSPDPLNPGFFVKTGQQRTEGIEVGLQGEVTKRWQVYAGYAHLDGRITQATSTAAAGARLQLVPQNTLSAWNRVEIGNGWSAGLGVVRQGASFAALDNAVTLPAFTRADAALYYALEGGKTRLALNVENVFDRRYFPTADGNNNITPGAPRNARLTLTTSF
jgi:catecholate siderophore receptor